MKRWLQWTGAVCALAMLFAPGSALAEQAAITVQVTPAPAEETPVAIDTPVVADTPVAVEAPVVEETPVVADTPVAVEAPAVEETPVVVEVPVAVEAPAVEETPVVVEVPVEQAPAPQQTSAAVEEMPVVTDQPLTAREVAEVVTDPTERMKQAQLMLTDLHLYAGAADGLLGPQTALAIRTFQERWSLEITGMLNDETFIALNEKSAEAGSARRIQQRLIDLCYLRGKADGIFGERSQAALKLFQTMHGLAATGEMDAATESALFSDGVVALPERLTRGDKGEAVQRLQEKLRQFGFLTDKADGNYGPATATAVKRFQNHLLAQGVDAGLGIAATGEATSATQALLFDPAYSTYLCDIAQGLEGSEALRVERRLSQLGYMDMQPDEVFDEYAARTAAAFRDAVQLGQGDSLDKACVDALFSDAAPVAAHYVLHDIAYKDRGTAVREMETLLVRYGMTIKLPDGRYDDSFQKAVAQVYEYLTAKGSGGAQLFADSTRLTVAAQEALNNGALDNVGVVNPAEAADLKRIQRRLHTLYYLDKNLIDGVPGSVTTEAVSTFQATNGLNVTGVADAATLNLLFSDAAVYKRLPYRVEISIDDQRVYVYELNAQNEYERTQEFKCSTGLGNSTPRGIFLDCYPCDVWHYFEKFKCWAKYAFEVEGNIMIHSVIFSEAKESTLRESSLYGLGQKASHGCIRLKVSDAYWLYSHCKRGTLAVVIY